MEITIKFANLSNVKVNPDSDFIFHFIYNFSRMTWLLFFFYSILNLGKSKSGQLLDSSDFEFLHYVPSQLLSWKVLEITSPPLCQISLTAFGVKQSMVLSTACCLAPEGTESSAGKSLEALL